MPGVTPNEGRTYLGRIAYRAEARAAGLRIGLFTGTWNGSLTRTYGQANDSALTKVTATGLEEKTLTDGTWNVTGNEASYADQTFTNSTGSPVTVNGYYIAAQLGGTWAFLHIERDPVERTVQPGASYIVGPSVLVS